VAVPFSFFFSIHCLKTFDSPLGFPLHFLSPKKDILVASLLGQCQTLGYLYPLLIPFLNCTPLFTGTRCPRPPDDFFFRLPLSLRTFSPKSTPPDKNFRAPFSPTVTLVPPGPRSPISSTFFFFLSHHLTNLFPLKRLWQFTAPLR